MRRQSRIARPQGGSMQGRYGREGEAVTGPAGGEKWMRRTGPCPVAVLVTRPLLVSHRSSVPARPPAPDHSPRTTRSPPTQLSPDSRKPRPHPITPLATHVRCPHDSLQAARNAAGAISLPSHHTSFAHTTPSGQPGQRRRRIDGAAPSGRDQERRHLPRLRTPQGDPRRPQRWPPPPPSPTAPGPAAWAWCPSPAPAHPPVRLHCSQPPPVVDGVD